MEALDGRTAVITGATGGLGSALTRAFWSAGASLCLTARDPEALGQLREDILGSAPTLGGQRLFIIPADLLLEEDRKKLTDSVETRMGTPTILINNAAVQGPIGPLATEALEEWERTIRMDLFVPVSLCRAFLPGMIQRKYGKIINISGGGATGPRLFFSAYAAAKTALARVTEILAEENRGKGVDANCIAPGAMNTRMLDEVLAAGPELAGHKEYNHATSQRENGGALPDKAAALAVFLASAQSDGLSGLLVSAIWDKWEDLHLRKDDLVVSDVYRLRRIVPKDRGWV